MDHASAGTAQLATDVTASPTEFCWSKDTTPLEAIERALYALADQLSGDVSARDEEWVARIYPRSATADTYALAHQVRQAVTDHTLRVRIAERTDPLRNLVFALAFSRSGLGSAGGHGAAEAAAR